MATDTTALHATRREFLLGTGALVVSFSLAREAHAQAGAPAGGTTKPLALDQVDTFLAVHKDGTVTMYTGKVDLGTGIRIALPQMVAEELDVRIDKIKLIEGDTALTPDQGPTWGSLSVQVAGVQLRQAAATARQALVQMAVQKLGMPVGRPRREGRRHLRARRAASPRLVRRADRRQGLRPQAGPDRTAQEPQGPHHRRPAHGAARRPRQGHGHSHLHAGLPRARHAPRSRGAAARHRRHARAGGRGVHQGHQGRARRARGQLPGRRGRERVGGDQGRARQLKATWSTWEGLPDQSKLWEHVRGTQVAKDDVAVDRGNPKPAIAGAAGRLKATYDFAIHTHGSIGPSCAVADVKGGKAEIWSPSQAPHWLRRELAVTLQMDAEGHPHPVPRRRRLLRPERPRGRHRGRRAHLQDDRPARARAVDARGRARLGPEGPAHARGDHGGARCPGQYRRLGFRALGAQGRHHRLAAHAGGNAGRHPPEGDRQPRQYPPQSRPVLSLRAPEGGGAPTRRTPFRPSWIRTPGRMQNTYANEVFIDECAAAAGADPVEYRLRYLTDPRGIAVLRAAAHMAKWDTRPSPRRDPPAPSPAGAASPT